MISISSAQFDLIAHERLLLRLGDMLRACAAVGPELDPAELRVQLETVLEQAQAQGIRTERLLGMYALIRFSDRVDPRKEGRDGIRRDRRLARGDAGPTGPVVE